MTGFRERDRQGRDRRSRKERERECFMNELAYKKLFRVTAQLDLSSSSCTGPKLKLGRFSLVLEQAMITLQEMAVFNSLFSL